MFDSWGNAVAADDLLVVLAAVMTIALAIVFVSSIAGGLRRARPATSRGAPGPRKAGRLTEPAARDTEPAAEADGLESYRWAVAVREDALGPDHLDVATACHILGAMYAERARFTEAEPLLMRALAIRTRAFGPAHGEVALTIEDLADLYRAQGRDAEAESLLEGLRAIQPTGRLVPAVAYSTEANSPVARGDVATADEDSAPASTGPRQPSDAEPKRLPQLPTSKPGSEAPRGPDADSGAEELSRVLGQLAGLDGASAEPDSAQDLYRRALAMMEATGATDRPELRTVLRELGRLYYRQGAFAEAEPLLERALALAQRVLGAGDSEVTEIREDLAWLRFSERSLPGP